MHTIIEWNKSGECLPEEDGKYLVSEDGIHIQKLRFTTDSSDMMWSDSNRTIGPAWYSSDSGPGYEFLFRHDMPKYWADEHTHMKTE